MRKHAIGVFLLSGAQDELSGCKVKLIYQALGDDSVKGTRETIAEADRSDVLHASAISEGLTFHKTAGWPFGGYFTDPDNDEGVYWIA